MRLGKHLTVVNPFGVVLLLGVILAKNCPDLQIPCNTCAGVFQFSIFRES